MIFVAVMLLVFFVVTLFIKPKCPDCGGKMTYVYYDAEIDRNVYKCEDCGEEWI